MICPECKENNLKSKLSSGGSMKTLLGIIPYYDEKGNKHYHDRNTTTTHYMCSNGHAFKAKTQGTCPSYPDNCDFHNEPIFEVTISEKKLQRNRRRNDLAQKKKMDTIVS